MPAAKLCARCKKRPRVAWNKYKIGRDAMLCATCLRTAEHRELTKQDDNNT